MLKEASANDSIGLINSVKNRSLLADYGMYQIFYYKGIKNLLKMLKGYVSSPKQVIIPQTIAGLFELEPRSIILNKKIRERIYEDLLNSLSPNVKVKIAKLDKKYNL